MLSFLPKIPQDVRKSLESSSKPDAQVWAAFVLECLGELSSFCKKEELMLESIGEVLGK